ncbi:hypothetical protein GCM10027416_26380 [Okibacterium endophyticum]
MRIQLKVELDCEPRAVWRALHSPAVLQELYGPLVHTASGIEGGFPTSWTTGTEHVLTIRAAGLVPLGRQRIALRDDRRPDGTRILSDEGGGVSGPLASLASWRHRMAVSAVPDRPGAALYRDRLDIGGPAAALYWYPLWALWQWREVRMKQLAPTWAYDPEPPEQTTDGASEPG